VAIGDDFSIDYVNKIVYHSSGTTVYTVNQLYSWLQDTFDELVQMDDTVPMSAQTPTAYTLINGWYLDRLPSNTTTPNDSLKYLRGGAIQTSGRTGDILVLSLTSGSYVSCADADIGEVVTDDASNVGPLLGFDNTLRKWIIRDTNSHGAITSGSTMDIPTGTGSGIADGDSASGDEVYSNVYTLGTITTDPYPQVYIFQAGSAIAEWSTLSNWDRGHIDIVIMTAEAGVDIDAKQVTIFARQPGDLYDHFTITLTTSGQDAAPLSTATDLDNTTPEYYIFYDAGNGTDFTAKEVINDDGGDWSAEVVSFTEWSAGIGVLGIRGFKGTIADGDTFTGVSSGGTGTINGSGTGVLGTAYIAYDNWGTQDMATGNVCTGGTSGAKRRIIGLYEDVSNTSGYLLFDGNTGITGVNRTAYYKSYTDDEQITDGAGATADVSGSTAVGIAGYDDITIAFVNGTATHGGTTGTFTEGERITWSGGEGIVLYDSGSALTIGNATDTAIDTDVATGDISGAQCTFSQDLQSAHTLQRNFEQQASYPYDVFVQCGDIYNAGRTLAQVYEYFKFVTGEDSTFSMYTVVAGVITVLDGEEYIQAYTGYTPKKQSPLATFAGGKLFGAQGVWVEGMASQQSFSLIDSNGTVQDPPVKATLKITDMQVGDRVSVFIKSGNDINKTQYNSHDTNNSAGDTTFEIEEDITQDTPASGTIRVVDDDQAIEFKEQRYRYASWTGKIFTLVTGATGSDTGDSQTGQLTDSGADFGVTDNVEVGDVIRNTTDGSRGIVLSVDSTTVLQTYLMGGSNNYWSSGDAYDTNKLAITYDDGDTAYVPFLDLQADQTSEEVEVIYLQDRSVLIRVRKKGIIPFETSGTFLSSGLTVAAIRQTDGIVQ
jgi:hypothetical protein